jgi:large subunit ribosomal protein L21
MTNMYAIVETGGRQYKVTAGDKIKVDFIGTGNGKEIELTKVMLIADGENTIVGNPVIENARVIADCLGEGKDKKIIVLRYKNKTRYHKKTGHRQLYSTLQIKSIVKPDGETLDTIPVRGKKTKSGGES